MEFGWINVFGAAIVILMLIPNIIYAINHKDEKNLCDNRLMNITEQVGRYACIILMWLPLLIWKFGFTGIAGMILYLAGNAVMLAVYWIIFAGYMKEKHRRYPLNRQNRDNMTDGIRRKQQTSMPIANRRNSKKKNTACCRDNKP